MVRLDGKKYFFLVLIEKLGFIIILNKLKYLFFLVVCWNGVGGY